MPDKLTDKEIVKALECCMNGRCDDDCTFRETCEHCHNLDSLILDLINRLQAENERLKTNLNIELENFATEYDSKIKAEAYKEFAERCKKKASMYGFGDKSGVWVNTNEIDNLLKELVGDSGEK